MKIKTDKLMQYLLIITAISAVTGFYFYINSTASTKINSSQETKLTDGLVGYWTFDGSHMDWSQSTAEARDQSTYGNHGDAINMTSSDAAIGKIGQALSFDDGNNDYVDTGFVPVTGTSARTLVYWAKHTSSGWQTFMKWGSNRAGEAFHTGFDGSNRMAIDMQNDYGYCGDSVSNNEWNFFALVMEEGTTDLLSLKPYVNGELKTITRVGAQGTINTTSDDNFTIGMQGLFNGQIDEVRIYNRALAQTEITQLYSQGQTKINASQETKLTDGLTGYWSLDGNHMDWSQASAEVREMSGANICSSGTVPCHGDVQGGASSVLGKIGQAMSFDSSSSQYVSTAAFTRGANAVFQGRTGTVSLWMRPTGSPVNVASDAAKLPPAVAETRNGGFGIFRGTVGGGADKIWAVNSWEQSVTLGIDHTVGEWTHVTFVIDNDNTRACVYKNGAEDGCDESYDSKISYGEFTIGKGFYGNYFTGDVDEVRTYNRALTSTEISQLYNQGQVKINSSQDSKLTDGLVGNWTFDGNHMDWGATGAEVLDQGTGGNDGAVTGLTNADAVIGKVGQALDFDGGSDYVDIAGFTQAVNVPMSYGAWIKFDSVPSRLEHVLFKDGGFELDTHSSGFDCAENNTGRGAHMNVTWSAGQWYHIFCAMDSGSWTAYLNGSSSGSTSDNFYPTDAGISLKISNDQGVFNHFTGQIDEVRIYNRALSASEIDQLYMMGK